MSLENDLNDRSKTKKAEPSYANFDSSQFNSSINQESAPLAMEEIDNDGGRKIMRRVLFGSFIVMFVMYLGGVSFLSVEDSSASRFEGLPPLREAPPTPPAINEAELSQRIAEELAASGIENSDEIAALVDEAMREARSSIEEAGVQSSILSEFTAGLRDGVSSARYSDELLQGMGDWMAEMGYGDLTREELVELRDKGVTATYTNGMRELGYDLTLDEVVRLSQAEVSVRFAAMMQSLGYDLSTDDLVRLERAGVTAFYTSNLHDLGYRDITLDQLVRFQQVGVTTNDIKKLMSQSGGVLPSFDDVVRYKISNQ